MTTLFARLTERELDQRIADKLLPPGCDQQGRYATRPEPAEACTEIGHDFTAGQIDYLRVIVWIGSPVLMIGLIALVALYV